MTAKLHVPQFQLPLFAEACSEDSSSSCSVWQRNLEVLSTAHDPGWVYATYAVQGRDPGWQRIWFCPQNGQRSEVQESCTETFLKLSQQWRVTGLNHRGSCSDTTPETRSRCRSAATMQYKKGCLVTEASILPDKKRMQFSGPSQTKNQATRPTKWLHTRGIQISALYTVKLMLM